MQPPTFSEAQFHHCARKIFSVLISKQAAELRSVLRGTDYAAVHLTYDLDEAIQAEFADSGVNCQESVLEIFPALVARYAGVHPEGMAKTIATDAVSLASAFDRVIADRYSARSLRRGASLQEKQLAELGEESKSDEPVERPPVSLQAESQAMTTDTPIDRESAIPPGLTKREWCAALILAGLAKSTVGEDGRRSLARMAVAYADALKDALAKGE